MKVFSVAALCAAIIPNITLAQTAEVATPARIVPVFEAATEPLGAAKTVTGVSVACFGRMTTQEEHPSVPFRVVVPLDQVEAVARQGFMRIDCKGRERRMGGYKRMVCEMAASGNDAVQARLKQVIGFEPVTLCSTAKKVAPEPGDDKIGPPEMLGLTSQAPPQVAQD